MRWSGPWAVVARTLVANQRLAGSACGKRQRGLPLNAIVRAHLMSVWKPSAIFIGFFAGFVVPYIALAAMFSTFQYENAAGHTVMPSWFVPVPFVIYLIMPVAGGFTSAYIAKRQPLLHGLLVGVLGALAVSFMSEGLGSIALAWVVFVSGAVAGGWLFRARASKRDAP